MPPSLSLTPSHARFVYWLNGLSPISTSIVTPWVVSRQLRDKPLDARQKKAIVIQEICRQIVSNGVGLASYFGGGELSRRLIPPLLKRLGKTAADESTRHVGMIVGGTIMSFIGYGFIRPLISTELIVHWFQRFGLDVAPTQPDVIKPVPALPSGQFRLTSPADTRMQGFFQNIEARSGRFRGLA